jgi:hypothetical protein
MEQEFMRQKDHLTTIREVETTHQNYDSKPSQYASMKENFRSIHEELKGVLPPTGDRKSLSPSIIYAGEKMNFDKDSFDLTTLKADFVNSNDFNEYCQPNYRVGSDKFSSSHDEYPVFNEQEMSYHDASDASMSECFSMIPSESQEYLTKAKKANYIPLSERMQKKMF